MKSHLLVAISLSLCVCVVLASRRLFLVIMIFSSRAIPSLQTRTITARSQVIVQGVPLNPATIFAADDQSSRHVGAGLGRSQGT
jgi:hypothetical protein